MGDKGSEFGDDRELGGGFVVGGVLEGGLEGEGGLFLPPMAVGVQGGGGPPSVEVVEDVDEQGEVVHGGGVVGGHQGGHFTSDILSDLF